GPPAPEAGPGPGGGDAGAVGGAIHGAGAGRGVAGGGARTGVAPAVVERGPRLRVGLFRGPGGPGRRREVRGGGRACRAGVRWGQGCARRPDGLVGGDVSEPVAL